MDALLLPILIAATVTTLVLALSKVVGTAALLQKRKLQQRLSNDARPTTPRPAGPPRPAITVAVDVRGVPAALARRPFIQRLHKHVVQAYPDKTVGHFLALVLGMGVVVGGLTLLVTVSVPVGLAAGMGAAYLPFMRVNARRGKRQKQIALQIPESLEFLTRVLRAGHSLSTGLMMLGEELPKPLSEEFRRAYDQHSMGQSLEDALKDMANRVDSGDFAFFVTAVLIQRQTGGDLSEVLQNISGMIRGRIRLAQSVKAKTAEGRFTGYVLVAFPMIMFMISYVMNPDYAGVLINTGDGRLLLGFAVALQLLGLYAIRKITTVKV